MGVCVIDIKKIINDFESVSNALSKRSGNFNLDRVKELIEKRKMLMQTYEDNQQILNKNKGLMAKVDKKSDEFIELRNKMKEVSNNSKEAKLKLSELNEEFEKELLYLPNMPQEMVPVGKGEEDNKVLRYWGEKPKFDFEAKNHWDLDKNQDFLDFERASKITGSKFNVLRKNAAKMERALINFMLDIHSSNGYEEIFPPFIVNKDAMTGTGQLPKFAEDAFKIEGMDYYLIPTAEVPITNLYNDEILKEENLPLKMVAYSACFRKEAGSAGLDTRGLIRQHQFNKVELVKIVKPEDSEKEHFYFWKMQKGYCKN